MHVRRIDLLLTHRVGAVRSAIECGGGRRPLGRSQSEAGRKGREQNQILCRFHGRQCSGIYSFLENDDLETRYRCVGKEIAVRG